MFFYDQAIYAHALFYNQLITPWQSSSTTG